MFQPWLDDMAEGSASDRIPIPGATGAPSQVLAHSDTPYYAGTGHSVHTISSSGDGEVETPRISRRLTVDSHASAFRQSSVSSRFSNRRWTSGLPVQTPGSPWSLFGQLMEGEGEHQYFDSPELGRALRSNTELDQSHLSLSSHSDPFLPTNVPTLPAYPISESPIDLPEPRGSNFGIPHHDFAADPEAASNRTTRRSWVDRLHLDEIPILYRNIFKCSVAYFIASLFTFSPYLSGLISDITTYGPGERRPSPSGHMVATVAVYFNPAKTAGAMLEADVFCLGGLVYSALVCLCSMSMFWWLEVKPGWEWLADVLVILWLGLSISGVAWMKVWMAKHSFNTACSMTALILFIVIVKEGGAETLIQVSSIVLMGTVISNLVCYCIWPQSARANLQENMIKTLDSFSTLLHILTNTFLLEEPLHNETHEKLLRAVESHQSSFTTLKKSLSEAHSEWLYSGPIGADHKTSGAAYEDAVDCLNRLAQHLNGLRGGTRLQYELIRAQMEGKIRTRVPGDEQTPERNGKGKTPDQDRTGNQKLEDDMLNHAAAMFGDLVDDLGHPVKSVSVACTSSLSRIREAFVGQQANDNFVGPEDFHQLVERIEDALSTFETISNEVVMHHYMKSEYSAHASVHSLLEDSPMYIGSDTEHVFLVYHFVFTLQEFARELVSLIDVTERIYGIEQVRLNSRGFWMRLFLKCTQGLGVRRFSMIPIKPERPSLKHSFSSIILSRSHRTMASFPKIQPHAPDTIQTPSRSQLTFMGRVQQSLWSIGSRLKESDIKYAIKAGMATGILAAPAFFDATRPLFTEYRGEWALMSFFIVISPTIGATNFMSVHRILGTLFGAGMAAGIFTLFPHNPVVLSIFGFFFSMPCFYYIVAKPEYATTGRFVLLTYNLTCLFCYNLREVEVPIVSVALKRSVSVVVGVVWAAVVSRLWWPSEARRELSKALGEFCLNIGWLYTRLVASNSFSPEELNTEEDWSVANGASLLSRHASTKLNNSIQEFMAMELHLQIKLIELQGLLSQTQHEPRLKGPFPVALYRSILTSLQTILDKLHSMRCVTTREEWQVMMTLNCAGVLTIQQSVRQDFIIPVNKERREMVGNIILSFSTLASAFRLKAPLPPYLPPAEPSRQRLVDAIRRLDIVKSRDVKGSKHLLFFAYAMTMKGVTRELGYLGKTLQDMFGVIGSSRDDFEALFKDNRVAREI